MDKDTKRITITEREYKRLQNDSDKLAALEEMGVDNWSGYDDAMRIYRENAE